jgi:Tc5 transposase DNA-binding domain/helix-turn-helix, Psq domain
MPHNTNEHLVEVDALDLEEATPEQRIQMAIQAIERNGLRENGRPVLSIREAATTFKVPKSTLEARLKGRKTRMEAHESEKKLSKAAEDALVDWVKEMGRRGVPLSNSAAAALASVISGEKVGEAWVQRFRTRHPDLKVRWTTSMEKCRAQALNRTAVEEFYVVLRELIEKYNIPPENIYNMDEKGLQLGIGMKIRVLVDREQKTAFKVEDGNRELVTLIECANALGKSIPPTFIFQGQRRNLEWGRDNPIGAR